MRLFEAGFASSTAYVDIAFDAMSRATQSSLYVSTRWSKGGSAYATTVGRVHEFAKGFASNQFISFPTMVGAPKRRFVWTPVDGVFVAYAAECAVRIYSGANVRFDRSQHAGEPHDGLDHGAAREGAFLLFDLLGYGGGPLI